MARCSQVLLPTDPPSSPLAIAVLMGLAVVALVGSAILFVVNPASDWFVFLIYVVCPGIGASHMIFKRWRRRQHREEWIARAGALGLRYQERVTWTTLEPFLDLPLFRFGMRPLSRADSLAAGVFEGREVVLLHFAYQGQFLTWNGKTNYRRFIQTIALFSGLDELPDFHLTPEETEWDVLWPGWARALDVGRVVKVVGECDHPFFIRSTDERATARLFTAERLHNLGNLGGWTIESDGGNVAIYRHDEKMNADELPHFLHRALDIVRVLSEPARDQQSSRVKVEECR
jgi:hypothetical protein